MSADNWAICPKCIQEHKKLYQKFYEEAEKAYGKVSSEEYIKLLNKIPSTDNRTNFREDYTVGIYEDKFYVDYHGECHVCGFKVIKNIVEEVLK